MFFPCEHNAYQFRISSKWSLNLIIRHYCIYVKLEKIISIFIHILKFSSNTFFNIKSTKNVFWRYSVESINFYPTVQALVKTFHVYKQNGKGSSKFQRDQGQRSVKFKVLYWLRLPQLQPEKLYTIDWSYLRFIRWLVASWFRAVPLNTNIVTDEKFR